MRPFSFLSLLVLSLVLLVACGAPDKEEGAAAVSSGPNAAANIILIGTIYTGEGAEKVAALAIDKGRIVYVGDRAGVEKFRGGETQEIQLGTAVAYPGFVDGHAHLTGIGLREMTLNLEGTASVADLQQRIAKEIAQAGPDDIIVGRGWIETGWPEGRFPNRDDLDAVAPDHPVMIERADGHAVLLNSAALTAANIDEDSVAPEGGSLKRDQNGRLTGLLIDNAMMLAAPLQPQLTPARRAEALTKGAALYAARGWTGVHNMSVDWEDVSQMMRLSDEGKIDIRVYNGVVPEALDQLVATGPQTSANGRIITRAVKLYADGALGSRGAALKEPYADEPDSKGLLLTAEADILSLMAMARDNNIQVATHAIGDRGNLAVLDWYKQVIGDEAGVRWRIEHAQILDPADLPRFAAQGVMASMQPSHAISDFHFAPSRLGIQRLKGAYAWQSLWQSGAMLVGGSDAPVEQGDPMVEFYAATARHDLQGYADENWHPEEALSRAQALALFTQNPAFASFQEQDLGLLTVGRKADISIFTGDIMEMDFADMPQQKAWMTLVDGEIIYDGRDGAP